MKVRICGTVLRLNVCFIHCCSVNVSTLPDRLKSMPLTFYHFAAFAQDHSVPQLRGFSWCLFWTTFDLAIIRTIDSFNVSFHEKPTSVGLLWRK